jgi:cation transport ATPase
MSYIIRQSANRNDLLIEREHRKGGTVVALIFMADDMRDTAERVVRMLEEREARCLFSTERSISTGR